MISLFPAPNSMNWGEARVAELSTLSEYHDESLAKSEYRLRIDPEKCELAYGDLDGRQCGLAT